MIDLYEKYRHEYYIILYYIDRYLKHTDMSQS